MNPYAAMLIAAGAAAGTTALLGYPLIPWLHKMKFGQIILDIGPSWHKHKQGTPTMGGMLFIPGILLAAIVTFAVDALVGGKLFSSGQFTYDAKAVAGKLAAGLIMASLFGMLGFMDDYTKIVKKRNKGLSVGQKSVAQVLVIAGYLFSLYLSMGREPYTLIPFVRGPVGLGWFFWIFGAVVVYATINAVNFTDGVDGLCSSVTVTAAAALAVIAVLRGCFGVGIVSAALAGGCVGFLVWNRNPAKVIMGDTGSMFLGGMVVAISFALDMPVILLLVGIIYVIEGMSDVIQIGYFKMTGGKRVFKMAPIHHHFEMNGWKEKKIVAVFSLINAAGAALGVALVWFGLEFALK
ncbi:MAG: phospho-N-acetylmuramoyl-pentapeptide-transferase [Oscillospiraceae bacterium]|nr:phospho-N-acetylmuramoyl-pentapeptide-transferase [Oscillospiraceae bacterium]